MIFGNNIEKMGFEKSTWPILEVNEYPDGGQEIYMGKSRHSDASTSAPVWLIRKITIRNSGTITTIITEQTEGWRNIWDNHKTLAYKLI